MLAKILSVTDLFTSMLLKCWNFAKCI